VFGSGEHNILSGLMLLLLEVRKLCCQNQNLLRVEILIVARLLSKRIYSGIFTPMALESA
jgi:hypothetical protein